jgi:hypothetical protein
MHSQNPTTGQNRLWPVFLTEFGENRRVAAGWFIEMKFAKVF